MSVPSPVLFVCARNAVRSPMAEALWRDHFGTASQVLSCGLEPAAYPDGFMIAVMEEAGHDLSGFEPRDLGAMADEDFQLVICLAPEIAPQVADLAEAHKARFLSWDIPDPAQVSGNRDERIAAYRKVREALGQLIKDLKFESA